jgi:ADP-ribose pyrophosphatase YjhB (NUDIX family)
LGRLYPDKPIVGIGAIIVCDGKMLLEKRKNDPGKGRWSVPGGVVELGENVTQTVIREVKEETGLDVAEPEHIDVVDQITRDEDGRIKYHFVIIDYLVDLKGGTLKAASDADELEWVSLDDVEKCDLTGTFRAFFERNKELLKKLS